MAGKHTYVNAYNVGNALDEGCGGCAEGDCGYHGGSLQVEVNVADNASAADVRAAAAHAKDTAYIGDYAAIDKAAEDAIKTHNLK